MRNRLYVLEDIDAEDLKKIVAERSKTQEDKVTDEVTSTIGNLITLLDKDAKDREKPQKLTLANILEVMDGVMEMEGRMLIITTNYPEKLDKALIRPGRIDMKVHFGPMRGQNIIEMYKHYFEMDPPANISVNQLPDLKWTPAEVTQVFLNNMHNPEAALEELINSESLENVHLKTKEDM